MNDVEDKAARRARTWRNVAIAGGLIIFVVLVYVVTILRMGGEIANRPL